MARRSGDSCLTPAEARRAFALRAAGMSARAVARKLGRDSRTVDRLLAAGEEAFAERPSLQFRRRFLPPSVDPDVAPPMAEQKTDDSGRRETMKSAANQSITDSQVDLRQDSIGAQMINFLQRLIGRHEPLAGPPRCEPRLGSHDVLAPRPAVVGAIAKGPASIGRPAPAADPMLANLATPEHARLLLADIYDDEPKGGKFPAVDLSLRYREMCLARQIMPRTWCGVSRELRKLVGTKKCYSYAGRRNTALVVIPPKETRRSTRVAPPSTGDDQVAVLLVSPPVAA